LDILNSHGNTGLYCAAAFGFLEIVEFLYESGAKIHVVDADGDTPLHDAAFKGHLSTVKYLTSKNAHVNHRDRNGKTALDLAVAQRNEEIATLLKAKT
jgi:ankyrin repeat protein